MTFTEEWIADETLDRLAELVRSVENVDGEIIEFGQWQDITATLPRLAPGGIMCGDDYSATFPGVQQAVNELLPGFTVEREMWIYRNEEQ